MRKTLLPLMVTVLALRLTAHAEAPASISVALDPKLGISTVPLYDGPVPEAKGTAPVDTPTLTIFPPQPKTGNGTGIVIAPGGAYRGLAANLEGRQVADWFAARGVTAFVLKYRLGTRYPYPIPLHDAQQAIRWVRAHAADYQLSPQRIGMIGFSAGGHLTAMTGTAGDPGSRPDFLVLGYPWIDAMQPAKPHFIESYQTLMKIPEGEVKHLEEAYTPTLHVTSSTPPTFIYSTTDDAVVPVQASVGFYNALLAAGVPAEMHLFRSGKHGSGLGLGDPALDLWPVLLESWLRASGWLK